MEQNPGIAMIQMIQKMQREMPAVFRIGIVKNTEPLTVAVGENICDDEIIGTVRYTPKKGDKVLLACLDGDDNYLIIGKIDGV